MSKNNPHGLWGDLLLERFIGLKHCKHLRRVRAKGLSILGRKKMFTAGEWILSFHERVSTPGYVAWCNGECRALGERFGLISWAVAMTCLVKNYDPRRHPLISIAAEYPQIRVVTDNADPVFLTKLAYEAQKLGLIVIHRHASGDSVLIIPGYTINVPTPIEKPPHYSAFRMRVELPNGYPHHPARELQRQATKLQRELLLRLGYTVPKRLRTSSLSSIASKLEVKKNHLSSGAIYTIVDELYPDDDLSQDVQRRNAVKVKRNRLRKRLHKLENSSQ